MSASWECLLANVRVRILQSVNAVSEAFSSGFGVNLHSDLDHVAILIRPCVPGLGDLVTMVGLKVHLPQPLFQSEDHVHLAKPGVPSFLCHLDAPTALFLI